MPRRAMPESCRLPHGPYPVPRVQIGERVTCLFRDCEVEVNGWSDGIIPWPRGCPVGKRGHPSIVGDETLARAVRMEAAVAIRWHWGVSVGVVWRWRKALGVTRTNNPGSHRLITASAQRGADVNAAKEWTHEECQQRRRVAVERNYGDFLPHGYHGPRWTVEQLALLGTAPDEEVAQTIGRTIEAVRIKRGRRGIAKVVRS